MGFIRAFMQPLFGSPLAFISPLHFVQKPLRWPHLMANSGAAMAGAPNFALELVARARLRKNGPSSI
jgi:hypothetical protein